MNNNFKYPVWLTSLAVAALLSPAAGYGAALDLAQTPLFTTTSAEPNVFFMLDDSGSMDWDMLTPEPELPISSGSTGLMSLQSGKRHSWWTHVMPADDNNSLFSDLDPDYFVVPTQKAVDDAGYSWMTGVWRARNHNYNKAYYDPSRTYEPWAGVDSAGNAYVDASATAARLNPYDASSATVNLTASTTFTTVVYWHVDDSITGKTLQVTYTPTRYWAWEDTDGDGTVDPDDKHTLVEIKSGNRCTDSQTSIENGCFTRGYAKELQNFANWWTYHRRREYAAKYAVSHAIGPAQKVRMGMSTINKNNSAYREIASMNSDVATGNKKSLMDKLFSMQSKSGTPLNAALKSAGDYYACSGSNLFGNSNCPIQTNAIPPATEAAGVCQQNFTVLVTDGYYTDTASGVGDADSDGVGWNNDGKALTFDGAPYKDDRSNTLADVAMYYYERDLNSSLDNRVPTRCGIDENPGQHMVTYTVGFGIKGSMDTVKLPLHPKRGYGTSCTATPASDIESIAWTDPSTDAGKADELLHAAYNGRGQHFNTSNPDQLTKALSNTLKSISNRSGTAAAVSFNSTVLDTGSLVFLGLFNSSNWSGDLEAYELNSLTGLLKGRKWSAAASLDDQSTRTILTHNGTDGTAFQWDSLTDAQKNDLRQPSAGTDDATAKARLAWLRGDRSDEGKNLNFRTRDSRLGDIVDSTPVYVGVADVGWPNEWTDGNGESYLSFKSSTATRKGDRGVVYVGANDGMLHGFRETDGKEVLAYVPGSVYSTASDAGLHYLTSTDYNHRYYVDGSPTISDVVIKTSGSASASEWRTVLVGSLRGGGRGLFALDVTDPDQFQESKAADIALWEFAHKDLGFTYSPPILAKLNNDRWAAIFGNGYNNTGSGTGKLFVLYLDGGVDGTWTYTTDPDTSDYLLFDTGSGDTTTPNGLSAPAVIDLDGNGTADRVYAGDLKGQMWVFDLCNADDSGACQTTGWGPASTSRAGAATPLFTAIDNQPITTEPSVVQYPSFADKTSSLTSPELMVYFGTGQYLTEADKTSTTKGHFYGVFDGGSSSLTYGDLVQQTVTTSGTTRTISDNSVSYKGRQLGWYLQLPIAGERVVFGSLVRNKIVYFNTMIPSINPCAYGGSGWLMSVDAQNGGMPDRAIFDTNNDGKVDKNDTIAIGKLFDAGIPAGTSILGNRRYVPGTGNGNPGNGGAGGMETGAIEAIIGEKTGRLSWEELQQ
jgi:type IV pilus assembly protein PilY1